MRAHWYYLAFISGFLGAAFLFFRENSFSVGGILFFVAVVLGMGSIWYPHKLGRLIFVSGGILSAVFLGTVTLQYWQPEANQLFDNKEVRVVGYPIEKVFYQEVVLKPFQDKGYIPEKKILWQASFSEKVTAGDTFIFFCQLEPVENFSQDFNYQLFLAKEDIGFICKNGIKKEEKPPSLEGRVAQYLSNVRSFVEHSLTKTLPEPELGLAKGLILGGGDFMTEELQEKFVNIGMTHIVAVSGYNILLVATFLLVIAGGVGFGKNQRILIALLGVVLFIFFVGAPASAVRAGWMAGFVFLAFIFGRRVESFLVLLSAAFVMLLWNPLLLFYDIGFQLSFLALIGILFAVSYQNIGNRSSQHIFIQAILITLSVEIFVLPLVMYHFGTFAWFSIFANILLLPLIPLAMFGSFFLIVATSILPTYLVPVVTFPVYGVLFGITRFATYFGSKENISFENIRVSFFWICAWYALAITIGVLQLKKRKKEWYAKAFVVDDSLHNG